MIGLVALALLVRLGYGLAFQDPNAQPRADEPVFTSIALNLLEGKGYNMNGTDATAQRPPFYPFLLSAIFGLFGKGWMAARLVNILISALSVGLIFLLTRRLFGTSGAILAGTLAAIYPPFVEYAWRLYSDTVYLFLFTLFLLIAVRLPERRANASWVLALGAVGAAAMLTRIDFGLIVPMTALWIFSVQRPKRKALKTSLTFLAIVFLLVAPWIVRNRIVFGRFVLSTNFGAALARIYNEQTFSDWTVMGGWGEPATKLENRGEPRRPGEDLTGAVFLSEAEWEKRLGQMGVAALRRHVTLLPRMTFYKLQRLFFSMGAVEALLRFPLIYFFTYGSFTLLITKRRDTVPLYLAAFGCLVNTLLFCTENRLRMPFDAILIVVASQGAVEHFRAMQAASSNEKETTSGPANWTQPATCD